MTGTINWTCKTCGRHTTLGSADHETRSLDLYTDTSLATGVGIQLRGTLVKCPNRKCGELDFQVEAKFGHPKKTGYGIAVINATNPVGIGKFRFLPTTTTPLSKDAPPSVQADYTEACLILELSPKSSATLARRALQGMIRDFWGVSKHRLADELKAISDKCDPELYEAMMALKGVGNIGAHPERDVNLVIDIEPQEAKQLLDLIHLLDREWYVARSARKATLQAITALGEAKEEAKQVSVPPKQQPN